MSRIAISRINVAIVFLAALSLPTPLLAQTASATTSVTGSPGSKTVVEPTPNATTGGSIKVPTQSDGHVNIASPPGTSTSAMPPQSTVHTANGSGNPMGASGSVTGN